MDCRRHRAEKLLRKHMHKFELSLSFKILTHAHQLLMAKPLKTNFWDTSQAKTPKKHPTAKKNKNLKKIPANCKMNAAPEK